MSAPLYAAIEAGGTKFVLAVASEPNPAAIIDRAVVPTDDPEDTLQACRDFFSGHAERVGLRSLGIGTFGPVDLEPGPNYGTIVKTPKPGWSGTSLTRGLASLGVPIIVDTDVNAAALAEAAAASVDRLVYFTIGTGIGGGVVIDGESVTGRPHPEAGHMAVERMAGDDYPGRCPYHGACGEGMTSGPALEERFGVAPGELATVIDRAVPLAAFYIAQLVSNTSHLLAPDRVVVGGGIMGIPGMFAAVNAETERRIAGYTLRTNTDPAWLTPPILGTDSGIAGALLLAERAEATGVASSD